MKKGLVLEGGAMRGMFTCGVIDVFMENNIKFDAAIGVSAGAAFGCNIKSEQIGRPVRYNKKFCQDERYGSYKHWLQTGDYFNNDFLYGDMIYELDPWNQTRFESNPMEFWVVATNIKTGKAAYQMLKKGKREDIKWIQASSSIPLFAKPIKIGNNYYSDGGTSDSIPTHFFLERDYEKIVVVETQPYDYVKKPQKYLKALQVGLKDYPNLVEALRVRHTMYNKQKELNKQLEKDGRIFVLRPESSLHIKSLTKDPDELERVYQLGRKVALDHLDEIKAYLKDE